MQADFKLKHIAWVHDEVDADVLKPFCTCWSPSNTVFKCSTLWSEKNVLDINNEANIDDSPSMIQA